MEKSLKGEEVINKLKVDFNILYRVQAIRSKHLAISYNACVELEVISREMQEFEVPNKIFWKEVEIISSVVEKDLMLIEDASE